MEIPLKLTTATTRSYTSMPFMLLGGGDDLGANAVTGRKTRVPRYVKRTY
ncbi:MAG TPA: hypothetical protein VNV85_08670 [Puia sp.]|nr:hypothetical protein [Puia sp.]